MTPTTFPRACALTLIFCASTAALFAGETMAAMPTAPAPPPPLPPLSWDSWWNGPSLTYDTFGEGATMRAHGFYFQNSITQYGQGLVSGTGNHAFEYGLKLDSILHVEGQQLGLWKGISLDTHASYLYGDNALFHGGTASSVNTTLLLPAAGEDIPTLSSLLLTQKLFDDQLSITVGRFNTIDLTAFNPYDGGAGNTFWNISFVAPLVQAKTIAPVTNGAIMKFDTKHDVNLTFGVLDPQDSSTTTGLPNLYDNGVTLLGAVSVSTKFFGLAGMDSLTGTWSNQTSTELGQLRQILLPKFFGTPSTKNDTWSLTYHLEQAIYQPKDDPTKAVGIFGNIGISDGNPNPVKWSATAGVGGHSPIPGRADDRIGVGYYYVGLSDSVKNQKFVGTLVRDEQGTEMFYTAAINKFWNVTGDIQVIDPLSVMNDTDVVLGVSTKISF